MLTIDGLATGLDTTAIIEGLLSIQQSQIDRLNVRQQDVISEQSAFKGIEAQLLSLRSAASILNRVGNDVFSAKEFSSSDETILNGAASKSAAPGIYRVRVNSLATNHQVASQGFADPDSKITEGTIDLRVGVGAVQTIEIDSNNNTLQGLADAINNASDDVTATIINDGTSGASPFRLLLAAKDTGSEKEISIANNLGASAGDQVQPTFDFGNPVQAAADATIALGSGAGAITITSGQNIIDDVIPGITLDLKSADSGTDVTITVSNDTGVAKSAITGFVGSFNDLMAYIDDQVRFEQESGQASPLLGNRSVISIQDEVRLAVTEVVAGVDTDMNRLSALGITFDNSGRLAVNSGKLDDALNGRIAGVDLEDVRRLFALGGESSNNGIDFVLGSSRTNETKVGYEIDVTQAAERATITGTNSISASTVIDSSNDSFTITINSKQSEPLTLTAGTYDRQQLADLVESVISAAPDLQGRSVSVAVDNDALRITSDIYGNRSEITIGTGTALADLGFAGTESDFGQDVVGKFIADGVEETTIGSGRLLIGDRENANTGDLQVRVQLSSAQVTSGADAVLTVTRGLASRLDKVLESFLDPVDGRVKTINDGFDERVEDIQASIQRSNEIFQERQKSLLREFIALETAVSQLQSTGNLLSAQLGAFAQLAPR
jgi:flagellar hook-associated protein 2